MSIIKATPTDLQLTNCIPLGAKVEGDDTLPNLECRPSFLAQVQDVESSVPIIAAGEKIVNGAPVLHL